MRRSGRSLVSEYVHSSGGPHFVFLRITGQTAYRIMAVCLFFLTCIAASAASHSSQSNAADSQKVQAKPVRPKADAKPIAQADPEPIPRTKNADKVETPQQIFRPDDKRPRHDDRRLLEAGIRTYTSKRLKLYTDVDEDQAKTLPEIIDQLYVALESYFGPMPPDRAGTDFQMTGYLMRDMALFREFGLMPEEIQIDHGRHKGNEFWMNDQKVDYYRRHLMIHEATHCFMTYMPDTVAPVWYLEGMAELFGTHRLDSNRRVTYCVIPASTVESAGFGRIEFIRNDIASNKSKSIQDVINFQPNKFNSINHYAWSWALCVFLDGSPRYRERFRQLGRFTQGGQFGRKFSQLIQEDLRDLETEWTLFTFHLQYGFDIERAAIDFLPGTKPLDNQKEQSAHVAADRGWQSTKVRLEQGHTYRIHATGRFKLGEKPKPWISEPQGITFRYFEGQPIGVLLGCLKTEEGPVGGASEPMLQTIVLGNSREFQAPVTGTLYLRLNDAWNSLDDNSGQADVTVVEIPGLDGKR